MLSVFNTDGLFHYTQTTHNLIPSKNGNVYYFKNELFIIINFIIFILFICFIIKMDFIAVCE